MLRVSNQLAIAGIGALVVGIAAVVYLITSLVYGALPAVCAAAAIAAAIVWLWYGLAFVNSRSSHEVQRHVG